LDAENATSYHPFSPERTLTLTLLIDLDNTLLGNGMDTFIPAYLKSLGDYISKLVPSEEMIPVMLAATQKMFDNDNPAKTLKDVFDENFYSNLGLEEIEARDHFENFYAETFPKLRGITQYRPQAVEMVMTAISRGYQVGIATNPLFPRTAIIQRLEWAGLSPDEYPFCLIPAYESFHYAKPNPAFFAEFLGQMGWTKGPVVMVGDDLDHDVRGARGMGIPVFWITGDDLIPSDGPSNPPPQGGIEDVLPWIDSHELMDLEPDFSTPSALIAILRGIPGALNSILSNLSVEDYPQRPQPEEWSITEIACHLRDVESEVNLPRIKRVINEGNPFITGVDTDRWAGERDYHQQDGALALQDFVSSRREALALLNGLDLDGWDRPARHTIFGPTHLKELVSIIAGHDQLHITQVHQVLSKIKS
jgi:HAD superfamily hydrolase (TIGR01549 family)